jgi:Leucine-rich repeat (LRR) protein
LPADIAKMKNLKSLDLSGNPIIKFPKEMIQMTQLKEITLTDTGLSEKKVKKCLHEGIQIIF